MATYDEPTTKGNYGLDTFIADVPISERMRAVVYRREHNGKTYVRWRICHYNCREGGFYFDKWGRYGVIPVESAEDFGEAIIASANGEQLDPKPEWLPMLEAR